MKLIQHKEMPRMEGTNCVTVRVRVPGGGTGGAGLVPVDYPVWGDDQYPGGFV